MTVRRSNFEGTGLPPEKVAQIAPLAAKRRSASQIAKALGTTKGTIIGLTRRLGIQLNGIRPTASNSHAKSDIATISPNNPASSVHSAST